MSIQTPEQWLAGQKSGVSNSKSTNSKVQTPEEWLASQQPTEPSKPTLGSKVKGFVKDVAKSAITDFARVGATVIDPLEQKITGVPTNKNFAGYGDIYGLGQIPGQTFDQKTKDVVGGLAKGLSWMVGGEGAAGVFGAASKGKIVKAGIEGTVGAASGGFFTGAGESLQQGDTYGQAGLQGLKTGAISAPFGTVLGVASGFVGSKLGKKGVPEILPEAKTITQDIVQNVPEVLPTIPKQGTLSFKQATDVVDKLGFNIQKGSQILDEVNKKSGGYNLSDIEAISKNYVPDKTPTVVKPTGVPEPIIKTRGEQTVPEVLPVKGTIKQPKVDKEKVLDSMEVRAKIDNDNTFNRQTNSGQIDAISTLSTDEIKNVAFGNSPESLGVPRTAYISYLDNLAEQTGDNALAAELSKLNVASKQAQGLQATQIAQKGSLTDILRDIRKGIEDRVAKVPKEKVIKEQNQIATEIKKIVDNLDLEKKSKIQITEILDNITCK